MTGTVLQLTPMGEGDLPWVVGHEAELHQHPWSEGNFRDSLCSGHACWIVRRDAAPVGYGVVMSILDEAHLLNISIARSCQGQGLGRGALDLMIEQLRAHGLGQMLLEVRPSNAPALALYRRAGFAEIGRRKGYYPAPGGREDAIVMRCVL